HAVVGRLRENQHRRVDALLAQLHALLHQRHRQPAGPALEGGPGHRDGAVPVAVGLHHRAQQCGSSHRGKGAGVVADGAEVDLGPDGPARGHGPFWTIALRTSPRETMPTSLPSRTTGSRETLPSCMVVATASTVSSSAQVGGFGVMMSATLAATALCSSCSKRWSDAGSSR